MINDNTRNDSLTGVDLTLMDKINRDLECELPCVVTKVSSDRKFVSVRPLIRKVMNDGSARSRSIIEGLPVHIPGAGDLFMSFPVDIGDLGWIEASDRDLGVFLQSYDESDPTTRRKHSFSDAKFVPDIMTNFSIAEEDAGAVVIQNRSGSIKIALDGSQIRIVNGASRIEVNDGTVIINGARITPDGDVVTASGVSLDNHPHNQPPDSDGNTQEPTDSPTPTE